MYYILGQCVCILASFTRHAKRNVLCFIVLHGLSDSTKYFHITPYMAKYSEKMTEHKMCLQTFSTPFV